MQPPTALLATSSTSFPCLLSVGGENGSTPDGHKIEAQFGTVCVSKDGKTWENVFRGGPVKNDFSHAHNNLLRDLTYDKGTFVAADNPGLVTSKDGRNWKLTDTRNSFAVASGNGLFIAPSAAGILRSEDGVTWQRFTPENVKQVWGEGGAGHIRKVVFGNGVFVCVGGNRLSVTRDGKTYFHHRTFPDEPRRLTYSLAVSEDSGKTWQNVGPNINLGARKVYFFDGERIIGCGGG